MWQQNANQFLSDKKNLIAEYVKKKQIKDEKSKL